MSGEALQAELAWVVRKEEIEYFRAMQVYDKVFIVEFVRDTGPQPIGTRWGSHK